jgi:gas vesicle protein
MRNLDNMTTFLAGLGIGVAASMLLAPQSGPQTQKRIREFAGRAGDSLNDLGTAARTAVKDGKRALQGKQDEASQAFNDLNNKAKRKIDETADAATTATGQIIDRSKDFAHTAGKKMETGGRMLQDA